MIRKRGHKSRKKQLKKKLDSLTTKAIRLRDDDTCQMCGKYIEGSNSHRAHIIPVSKGNALRFELDNMILLCYYCHINTWHKSPLEAYRWFRSKYGDAKLEHLLSRKNEIVKFTEEDLEAKIKALEAFLGEKQ